MRGVRRQIVMVACLVACVGLIAVGLVAQEKPAAPVAPVYTELQQLKLSNLALQAQAIQAQAALLQQAMRQVDTDRTALILSIEKDHPGWMINRETLQWETVTPPTPATPKK